jgi:ABC-2 type transport system permease protein
VELSIVDEDGSEASGRLVAAFESLRSVDVSIGEREEKLEALDEGKTEAVVVMPAGFGAAIESGEASVMAFYDDADPIEIGFVTTTVEGVVSAYNRELMGEGSGVSVVKESVSGGGTRYIDFLTPGMVGMAIMYVNLGVGFMLVTWREQGILRRLGVTPLRPGSLIATQAASFALVSLAQVAIILSIGHFAFDVSISGGMGWLALTVILGVAAMLAIGYVIGSFVNSATAVGAMINAVGFPMLFLGGSYFPMDPPALIAPVVDVIPLTHLNGALREVVNGNGELSDLWVRWLALGVVIVLGFGASVRTFRWQ